MIYVTDCFNLAMFCDKVTVTQVSQDYVLGFLQDKSHNFYIKNETVRDQFYDHVATEFLDSDEEIADEFSLRKEEDTIILVQLVNGELRYAKVE